ncbi:hypothetical protein WR25_24892 [Diploscapter pachys]|uniref:C2H2-type domain-containing protein n=1 Tax=Diploscapter pachys TaxID=2018661 RepID=A0A2A2LHU1_9BILA|nr:hypothetical protein WR25_24892 [Diploscapter pachys]
MFKCKLCGAVEINSTALELHIAEIHLSFQPWQCMYCSNKGSTMEQIKSHCLLTHKLNSPKMTYSYDPAKSENLRRLLETSLIESAVNEATKKFDPKLFSTKMDEFQSINAMIANLPLQTPEILEISAGKNQDFGSCSSSSIDTSLPFKCPASITFKDNDLTSARTRPYHSVRVARPYLYSIRRASEPASDTDATTSSTSSRKRPHEEEDNDEMTKLEIKDGNVLVDVSSNKWRCKRCCLNLKAKDIRVHIHMHLYKQEQLPCLMCSCEGCDFGHFLKTTLTSHVTECHGHLGYFEPTPNISEEFFEKAQEMMELCFGKVPFKFSELSGWETSTTPTGGNFPCRFCNNSFPKNVFYSHAYYHLLSTEKVRGRYSLTIKICNGSIFERRKLV